jgi:hypothetical protein
MQVLLYLPQPDITLYLDAIVAIFTTMRWSGVLGLRFYYAVYSVALPILDPSTAVFIRFLESRYLFKILYITLLSGLQKKSTAAKLVWYNILVDAIERGTSFEAPIEK